MSRIEYTIRNCSDWSGKQPHPIFLGPTSDPMQLPPGEVLNVDLEALYQVGGSTDMRVLAENGGWYQLWRRPAGNEERVLLFDKRDSLGNPVLIPAACGSPEQMVRKGKLETVAAQITAAASQLKSLGWTKEAKEAEALAARAQVLAMTEQSKRQAA